MTERQKRDKRHWLYKKGERFTAILAHQRDGGSHTPEGNAVANLSKQGYHWTGVVVIGRKSAKDAVAAWKEATTREARARSSDG